MGTHAGLDGQGRGGKQPPSEHPSERCQVNDQPPEKRQPYTVTPKSGEALSVRIGPDGKPLITGGGLKQVNLGKIEAIGFRNILDLASHGMSRADAFTMHLFGFKNGSTVEITSSDSGRIENFTALGVHMDIEDIGGGSRRLMISMLAGWKPDSPA